MAASEPYEPPLADEAPPQLVTFLYLLMRDYLPAGVIEHLLMMSAPSSGVRPPFVMEGIGEHAERVARQLAHDGS